MLKIKLSRVIKYFTEWRGYRCLWGKGFMPWDMTSNWWEGR